MNIRFAGFGGQGIVLAGVIYGRAVVLDGKSAVQTQSYGSAARGGACKSDVIISDEEIYELEFPESDVLVAMSQEAYEKYLPHLKEDGILIIEKDLVRVVFEERENPKSEIRNPRRASQPQPLHKLYSLPATRIAESLGQKIMANMVMLGYMSAVVPIVSKDAVCQAIRELVPRGTEEKNIEAFEKGYKLGNSVKSMNKPQRAQKPRRKKR